MNQSVANLPPATQCAPSTEIDELPLPYVEIDAHGIVTRANRATLALHHPEQGELIGKSGWDLMAVDEKDRSSAAFLSVMDSGEDPPVMTRSIFDRSGSFRTYEFHRNLMRDAMGKPTGMRMVCVDVTETARALDEARRAQQWLENAMASLAEAVILTDILGVVLSVNRAAEELSGWRASDLIGRTIDELLPTQAFPPGGSAFLDLRALLDRPCKGTAGLLTRDRKEVRVEISTSPILDKQSGSISGVAALLRKLD
jgi:PAS domain S-box-containing protein